MQLPQASFHLEMAGPVTQTWETHRRRSVLIFRLWNLVHGLGFSEEKPPTGSSIPSHPDKPPRSLLWALSLTVFHGVFSEDQRVHP